MHTKRDIIKKRFLNNLNTFLLEGGGLQTLKTKTSICYSPRNSRRIILDRYFHDKIILSDILPKKEKPSKWSKHIFGGCYNPLKKNWIGRSIQNFTRNYFTSVHFCDEMHIKRDIKTCVRNTFMGVATLVKKEAPGENREEVRECFSHIVDHFQQSDLCYLEMLYFFQMCSLLPRLNVEDPDRTVVHPFCTNKGVGFSKISSWPFLRGEGVKPDLTKVFSRVKIRQICLQRKCCRYYIRKKKVSIIFHFILCLYCKKIRFSRKSSAKSYERRERGIHKISESLTQGEKKYNIKSSIFDRICQKGLERQKFIKNTHIFKMNVNMLRNSKKLIPKIFTKSHLGPFWETWSLFKNNFISFYWKFSQKRKCFSRNSSVIPHVRRGRGIHKISCILTRG